MKKLKKILFPLLFVFGGLLGIILFFILPNFNFGGFIDRILGKKYQTAAYPNKKAGRVRKILTNNDPLRNKEVVETEDGELVKLPDGISDRDVQEVIKVSDTDYRVVLKHKKITDG